MNARKIQKQINRILVPLFVLVMLIPSFTWDIQAETMQPDKEQKETQIAVSDIRKNSYASYVGMHDTGILPQENIVLPIKQAECRDQAVVSDQGIYFSDGSSAFWSVIVPKTGWYQFRLTYLYADADNSVDALAEVRINDELPFAEAAEIRIRRLWRSLDIQQDANGNDLLPKQEQILKTQTTELLDETGRVRAYRFWLEEGKQKVGIAFQRGGLFLSDACFFNETTLDYKTYHDMGHSAATDAGLTYRRVLQAENMTMKNDPILLPSKDCTGPSTIPYDPIHTKLNVVDGASFSTPGQAMSWELDIPEDGYYRIGMRCKQSTVEGLSVYRRITVDGILPFSEIDEWNIPYCERWGYCEFGGDSPKYLFLTAGKHILTMEVVTGGSGQLEEELEDIVYTLNYLYRKILVITGSDPDVYRDYSLQVEIPELIPAFQEITEKLQAVRKMSAEASGQNSGRMSVISQIEGQLTDFVQDPTTISSGVASYKSNISSLSSLMLSMQTQPLSIDYLVVLGEQAPKEETEAGFFASFWYHLQAFIGSFLKDYDNFNTETVSKKDCVTAWFNGGREQAEVLKQMIEEMFTPQEKITVQLQLVQVPLTQAILAGTAPDVVLNIARGQPVNLGARGALAPLTKMQGFEEVKKWFHSSAMVPYTYNQDVYGIPVTMDYHVLFYRQDILDELNIAVPQTWKDVYKIIPILQRANMSFGLPYSTMSTQATIEAGMGAKDIFPTLLMQNGASYYSSDMSALALDSVGAMNSFKQWTEFYTQYGFDLTYDFYNRFRTGEMPLGIQNYSVYNQLSATAPEIKGLWDFTLIPGTLQEDGIINRTEASSGTAAVIIRDSRHTEDAWKLLKWWVGAEAQSEFGMRIELIMGSASRSSTANIEAMKKLPWTQQQCDKLLEQMNWIEEIPEVVGGYYVARGIDNAFRNVVFTQVNYRESLMEQTTKINDELERKRQEIYNIQEGKKH